MKINMIGAFIRNSPFGTEIAFKNGLEYNGVDVRTFDPSRPEADFLHVNPDATIIFKNAGEWVELITKNRGDHPIIVYQPDDSRAPGIRNMLVETRKYCEYAFTFDKTGAEVAEEIGYKKAKKLLVTADTNLYKKVNVKKDIDFCFIGSISNPQMHVSRRRMVEALSSTGFNVFVSSIFDPVNINMIYNRSKVVLNHATDVGQDFGTGYGYQCRHFEAGFSGACLLSNELLDDDGTGPIQYCVFDSQETLIDLAHFLLETWHDGFLYEKQGNAFYNELQINHRPEHRAVEITNFIKEIRNEA